MSLAVEEVRFALVQNLVGGSTISVNPWSVADVIKKADALTDFIMSGKKPNEAIVGVTASATAPVA